MKKKILPVILAVFIILFISLSSASENNLRAKYIELVRETNQELVNNNSNQELISMAYSVCSRLGSGADIRDLIFEVSGAKDFSQETLVVYGAIIVKYSVEVFCPEYSQQVKDWVY